MTWRPGPGKIASCPSSAILTTGPSTLATRGYTGTPEQVVGEMGRLRHAHAHPMPTNFGDARECKKFRDCERHPREVGPIAVARILLRHLGIMHRISPRRSRVVRFVGATILLTSVLAVVVHEPSPARAATTVDLSRIVVIGDSILA